MAASMKRFTHLACLVKAFKFHSKLINLAIPIFSQILRSQVGYYTTTTSSISLQNRKPRCTSCGWNQKSQQRRTFFGFFKKRDPEPLTEDNPAYSVVKAGNVSATRTVPDDVLKPEYANSGVASKIHYLPVVLYRDEAEKMREAGAMARRILDIGASYVKPGVTTDFIDEMIHAACLENKVYPSTLNYRGFPKSVCTSVNNIMVHGIPDDRPLEDGDIINIDFTVFLNGYHGDVSETYAVGSVDDAGLRLIDTARRCRDEAIKTCGPMAPIARIGITVQSIAQAAGFFVCPSFVGHGIGKQFHCKPDIWHYANSYPEKMVPGMAFTIEPVILERKDSFFSDKDGWTILAQRNTRSAQFEHTILITDTGFEVLTASPDENYETPSKDEDEDEDDADADDKIRTPTSSSSTSEHRPKSPNSAKKDDKTTERHRNTSDWKFD